MVGIINDGQGVLFLVSFGPREEQHLGGLKKGSSAVRIV